MKFREKWKQFWTLDVHHAEGFTLVELIVVIAIMAILAGVGTVGYSGYIKSANKNADKVLVGNIIRAIETGTNSYAFVGDDSFKMGQLSYPVGFVALSTSGTSVVTSSTQMTTIEGTCQFKTEIIYVPTAESIEVTCNKNHKNTKTIYDLKPVEVTYCIPHTDDNYEPYSLPEELSTSYATAISGTGCTRSYVCNADWKTTSTLTINTGTLYCADQSKLAIPNSSSDLCELAYANQYGSYTGSTDVGPTTSGPLYDAIVAAFGSDLTTLTLSYEGWTSEEGLGYASFYTGATELMDSLDDMAGTLSWFSGNSYTAEKLGLSQTYDNTDEILTGVSNNIVTGYEGDSDKLLSAWNNDSAMTWDSYGFNLSGRENYSAMRAAYNSAFASYLDANGASVYSNGIRNYEKPVIGEFNAITLPALVCTDAFTDPESGLQDQLGCSDEDFEQLANLYQQYIESGACNENGSLIYDVLRTIDSTADVANAYTSMNGGSVYDYYNRYVNEMSALYSAAQAAAGDGIVIIVTVENGLVQCDVSPSAANPRND